MTAQLAKPSRHWPLSKVIQGLLLTPLLALSAGCGDDDGEDVPLPGPLMAGVAKARIPAPVGIGTVGYGGFGVTGPESPFNGRYYPATNRVHGHPEYRAVVISRGAPHEVIFLRADTVGVFQHFRRAVALELEERLGYSVEDRLIFGGTHTHSGPGRIIDAGPIYDLMADTFFPEHYLRMVRGAADVVQAAYADLAPARIGHAWASAPDGHNDRRCEDGLDYKNSDVPILAVERQGRIEALVYSYAVHGTVLGIEDFTLSREVSGAIEAFIEAGFDHPVTAIHFNSWGADMSPGSPEIPLQAGAAQPGGYERLLMVGRSVADDVHAALAGILWEEDPEVFAEVHRIPIGRQAIGYPDGMFDYEWGGVYCSYADGDDCDPSTTIPDLDGRCVPFPETSPLPDLTELAAGRVGRLAFVTLPGEPGTLLAEELLGRLASEHAEDNVMFLGYTMDYTGYAILEDDWWQGGYEASGHIWGPWQGEYLVDRAVE
ncbi:MAG: neutral/alkaline non-lysosomal ceramidase N-terminal domain-containing protein, partial [Polyangia bacterium]|nr:neutral/alkaline non-lysosomal ceramidase N-terminal domain-containing protein [Polyangia bacterium]